MRISSGFLSRTLARALLSSTLRRLATPPPGRLARSQHPSLLAPQRWNRLPRVTRTAEWQTEDPPLWALLSSPPLSGPVSCLHLDYCGIVSATGISCFINLFISVRSLSLSAVVTLVALAEEIGMYTRWTKGPDHV